MKSILAALVLLPFVCNCTATIESKEDSGYADSAEDANQVDREVDPYNTGSTEAEYPAAQFGSETLQDDPNGDAIEAESAGQLAPMAIPPCPVESPEPSAFEHGDSEQAVEPPSFEEPRPAAYPHNTKKLPWNESDVAVEAPSTAAPIASPHDATAIPPSKGDAASEGPSEETDPSDTFNGAPHYAPCY